VTPRQLKKLLRDADLSQRGAARAIEIHERTMRTYISGEKEIPLKVEYALRWVHQRRVSDLRMEAQAWMSKQ
jgi:hypothetical protein